jgi:hypothetical protein
VIDTGSDDERARVLSDLLEFSLPIDELNGRVRALPWGSETDIVSLSVAQALDVLSSTLNGRHALREFIWWSELIDGREDVGFEDVAKDDLRLLIHQASTPELYQIDEEFLEQWMERLKLRMS